MATESSIENREIAGAITSMGIDELIFNMTKSIADGQARLDQTCMALAVQMGDAQIAFEAKKSFIPARGSACH